MSHPKDPAEVREIDVDKHYRDSLVQLAQNLIDAISTSQATRGLPSGENGRRFWASVLLARLCGVAASLQRILPRSASNPAGDVWDSTSALCLCRNIFETDLALLYLCTDEMSNEDYELRVKLVFLHDSQERPRIVEKIGGSDKEVSKEFYAEEATRLRGEIAKNTVFLTLPDWKQKRLLEGRTPYYLSQDELLERRGDDAKTLRGIWELLSSHAHSYPFSYYRVTAHPNRGTGRENEIDKSYCGLSAQLSATMLSKASMSVRKLFPDVSSFPRCTIDWSTQVCSAVMSDKGFIFGMAKP
ncbi:DUF5677 domain-containing protein [Rhodoferax mekongensis]|uniref:DUF5677 domain-containing protein n=1 Tax=Rhodoferax mekongensis TaxID=3068341 RepID=UPI0028BE41C0|nr:DUF5677 domain-containing protein [Rhodoferax sp. TBRC 17199]MDT7515832.1 DUF5677 domain-containing protein [Rhodoferax sp. TBRC 17199]